MEPGESLIVTPGAVLGFFYIQRYRAGIPWRDLPAEFGHWNSVFTRFRRWVRAKVFDRIFKALSGEADFEYAMIDGTIVTVHQKASGAKGALRIMPSDAHEAA